MMSQLLIYFLKRWRKRVGDLAVRDFVSNKKNNLNKHYRIGSKLTTFSNVNCRLCTKNSVDKNIFIVHKIFALGSMFVRWENFLFPPCISRCDAEYLCFLWRMSHVCE